MSEEEKVGLILELFEWPDDFDSRYHALRILRQARGQAIPSPDDYRAGLMR